MADDPFDSNYWSLRHDHFQDQPVEKLLLAEWRGHLRIWPTVFAESRNQLDDLAAAVIALQATRARLMIGVAIRLSSLGEFDSQLEAVRKSMNSQMPKLKTISDSWEVTFPAPGSPRRVTEQKLSLSGDLDYICAHGADGGWVIGGASHDIAFLDQLELATPLLPDGDQYPNSPWKERFYAGYERTRRLVDEVAAEHPEWEFWKRWYDGFVRGQPLDWDLQRAVAMIPNDEWVKGPERIAKLIRGYEEEFDESDPIDEEAARTQVRSLLRKALKSELQARGLRDLIQMAIDAYRREISNALPAALEPLEQLPPILDQIALVLGGAASASKKEAELTGLIRDMARTISVLNQRLERANAAKCVAEDKVAAQSPRRLFAEAFYTSSGAGFGKLISSKLFWGGIIAGSAALLGVGGDASTDRLAWLCNEVILPEGSEGVQVPPSASDGDAKFLKAPN